MVQKTCSLVLGAMLVLAASGCGSSAAKPTSRAAAAWGSVSPSLVMPGMGMRGSTLSPDASAWEYSRNDDRLNVGRIPPASQVEYFEVETHERLRTDNGRPRDHSTTSIRSIQRRLDR